MAISRINPSTLLSKVRLLMRVADLSKPVSFKFMGLGANDCWTHMFSKESGPKGHGFELPLGGALGVFVFARKLWSNGMVESMKSQFPSTKSQVSVFRFQLLCFFPDTCLPRRSSTERRRDTRHLKPRSKLAIFTGKTIEP